MADRDVVINTNYHQFLLFSGAAAALDERRPGAGCPTGGSQGVGKQGEGALDIYPSSLVLGIDLIRGHGIDHD